MIRLMEGLLLRLPLAGVTGSVLAGISIASVLIARQHFNDPRKKAENDRVLLKELLEGFGLEVPSELEDPQARVIKSIKTS